MRVIIFHGTKGAPKGNWFPWLYKELEKRNIKALVPELPTPEGQNVSNWLDAVKDIELLPEDVLIGHSCGATFIPHLLEIRRESSVKAGLLVSPVSTDIQIPEYDALNETFINSSFDWSKIRQRAQRFEVIHGDNDPYVPLEQAQYFSENLACNLEVIPNGGHLNSESGYTEFPYLLTIIESL
jgi:hypothetical protein